MTLAPRLFDRRYDQLVELGRAQIPALHDSVLSFRPDAARLPRVQTSGSSGSPI